MTASPSAEADLSNWRSLPHSRWAFHHVPELLPCARIEAASSAIPLPVAANPPDLADRFQLQLPGGASMDWPTYLQATATDALVVLHQGKVVLEHYANGNAAAQPHILMSATKSVTGLLAGLLQQQGVLDIDRRVPHYLPDLAGTPYAGATLRHLLDMRVKLALSADQARAYEAATHWRPLQDGESSQGFADFYRSLAGLPAAPVSAPFQYVSANTDLLGLVMARAAGRSVAELLQQLLWQPMGAEHAAHITLDRAGSAARATGGLCATARDLARLGQLWLTDGTANGRPVLPPDWLHDILHGGDAQAWAEGEWGVSFARIAPRMHYRSGWYVTAREGRPPALFAMGIHGQNLFVDPPGGTVIAKLSSQGEPTDARQIGLAHLGAAALRQLLA